MNPQCKSLIVKHPTLVIARPCEAGSIGRGNPSAAAICLDAGIDNQGTHLATPEIAAPPLAARNDDVEGTWFMVPPTFSTETELSH